MPISCTSAQAIQQSENLKRELIQNLNFINVFGKMETEEWSKDLWRAGNKSASCPYGTLVMPRSYGQQVRGMLNGDHRPDLFIVDDLEDAESVHQPDQRAKRKEFLYADVLGAADESADYRIIYIGTVLHDDSLLCNLLEDSSWHSVRLELCDDEFHSNWPERFPDETIAEMYARYVGQGLEDVFYREYRNLAQSPGNAPFNRADFQYYEPSQVNRALTEYFVIIDPAKTATDRSCDTAIVGVGSNMAQGKFYVEEVIAKKLHPDETAVAACSMALRLGAHYIGLEKTGSGEYATWPLENYIRMQGLPLQVVELNARRGPSQYIPVGSSKPGKDARIGAALVPLYRQRLVYHNSKCPEIGRLEQQLTRYPRGKEKDIIDALAYIVGMMDIGERFFAHNFQITEKCVQEFAFLDAEKEDRALADLYRKDRELAIHN
jgi:hypothetical protein